MIFAAAQGLIPEDIFKTMAWVFTILSGVASIALTIHKFGLAPWKRVTLIVGVIIFGLAIVLVVIPATTLNAPQVVTEAEEKQISAVASELGDYSGGYSKDSDGNITTKIVSGEVNRVSEFVFAIQHPDGNFDAIYSGDFFTANLEGTETNCELIDLGEDRVLIVMGEKTEFIDLNKDQKENVFKVKKVQVKAKQA